ncbi:MAG: slipin family protein, partial [Bacteroidia bacterium]|nr:slipin family protein [Bacteroidia bacterium]
MLSLFIIGPIVLLLLFTSVKMITQYERGILFRMGKVRDPKGPGLLIKYPLIDRLVRVDLRTITLNVPAQDIITKDNVSVRVSAVVYYKVLDPVKAIIEVEDYEMATSQLAQTTLRSICGQDELDH